MGPTVCVFVSPPGDSGAHQGMRGTDLEQRKKKGSVVKAVRRRKRQWQRRRRRHTRDKRCGSESAAPWPSTAPPPCSTLFSNRQLTGPRSTGPTDTSTQTLPATFCLDLAPKSPVTHSCIRLLLTYHLQEKMQCHFAGLENEDGVPPLFIRVPEQPFPTGTPFFLQLPEGSASRLNLR